MSVHVWCVIEKLKTVSVVLQVLSVLKRLQASAEKGIEQVQAAASLSTSSQAGAAAAAPAQANQAPVSAEAQKAANAKKVFETVPGLLQGQRFEEAFSQVLSLSDLKLVVWLCKSSNAQQVLGGRPPALSAPVVLSLVHQLGFDMTTDTMVKVAWLREAVMALDSKDPIIAGHVPGVLKELLVKLQAMESSPAEHPVTQENDFRLLVHVVRSMCQ